KPLGVGILSAALKKGTLSQEGYAQMLSATTQLNTPGRRLSDLAGVHAMTDVTGFGLAGHLMEMCRGAKLSAQIDFDALPLLSEARAWAKQGVATGASTRNWASYGANVSLPADFAPWKQALITDPQTSGGLLVACAPEAVGEVMAEFRREGFAQACPIGGLQSGEPRVLVR